MLLLIGSCFRFHSNQWLDSLFLSVVPTALKKLIGMGQRHELVRKAILAQDCLFFFYIQRIAFNWLTKGNFNYFKALKPKLAKHQEFAELSKKFVMVNTGDNDEAKGEQFDVDGKYVPRIFFLSKAITIPKIESRLHYKSIPVFIASIHLIPKWRPINYSFVCMLISPWCLVSK